MIGAVDIGGTKIAVGMVDDSGKVLSRMEAPTDPNRYSDGIELIAHMLPVFDQLIDVGTGAAEEISELSSAIGIRLLVFCAQSHPSNKHLTTMD